MYRENPVSENRALEVVLVPGLILAHTGRVRLCRCWWEAERQLSWDAC